MGIKYRLQSGLGFDNDTWGQFHQHVRGAFRENWMRSFFSAHSVWRMENKFGKKCANLSLNFGVLVIGEIEQQFFFHQMLHAVPMQLFAWQKSLVKSTPDNRFDNNTQFATVFFILTLSSIKTQIPWHFRPKLRS